MIKIVLFTRFTVFWSKNQRLIKSIYKIVLKYYLFIQEINAYESFQEL